MSLRNLLPIGRTFEPSGDRLGRFRPAEPGLLPDFSRENRAERDGRFVAPDEAVRGETPEVVGAPPARVRTSAKRVPGRRLPQWLEQVLLVFMRSGNRRRGSRPVQEDLFLGTVKVAKNDLVTSDVEVVVRSVSKPKPMSASCRARLMALWWAPVARRLGRWGHRSIES